ncbi:sugar-binding protein [Crateriforma spongiae]|uniref:sugar-binding protein n=1 Tax=Crateriforma spongiae TaxID=2724528 RepID=UPI00197E7E7A|nr:sugar-binding protein [Crateriforma spongiae]
MNRRPERMHWFALLMLGCVCFPSSGMAQIKYFDLMKKEPEVFDIKLATCNQTLSPPVVNGVLDDAAWRRATRLSDFSNTIQLGSNNNLQETTAWLTHDDDYLYFAFSCQEEQMQRVRTETVRYDDPDILFDDRIEILLDPQHNHKNIIRLAFNANGITYDTTFDRPVQYSVSCIKGDDRWNTEWRVKTQQLDDRWTAEVAIAMDRIYPHPIRPGTTWGFNIVRDRHSRFYHGPRAGGGAKPHGTQQMTAWQPVDGNVKGSFSDRWLEPNGYADLVFDQNDLAVSRLAFHEAYANYNGSVWHKPQFFGDNPLEVTLQNHSGHSMDLLLVSQTTDYRGDSIRIEKDVSLNAKDSRTVTTLIPIRDCERQQFSLSVVDKDANATLYSTSYDTRVPPFVEFDLSAIYSNRTKDKEIAFSPVVIPEAIDGCSISFDLYRTNEPAPIATDRKSNLKPYLFETCFEGFDWSSLPSSNYTITCRLRDPTGKTIGEFDHGFTKHRTEPCSNLHASETQYSFGGQEGKATVVSFPAGERFVFWEHSSYVPWWDLENMAVTYEFMECWGFGNQGCSEPMQDKENRYSKVDIIENTPARVVLRWRYALGDPNYQIIFNEWVTEYYYLYPDGSGVRDIQFWANSDVRHEILQPQYVFPTGVIPRQMFEDITCKVFNFDGESVVNRIDAPVLKHPEQAKDWKEEVMRIFLKDRKHPYLIWSKREDIVPNSINKGLVVGDVGRSMGGHWPMQPMNVDVYSVVGTDRPYHSWLGSVHVVPDPKTQPNRWKHLIGVCDQGDEQLITIGTNWLYPPSVHTQYDGISFTGFDAAQKAFVFHQSHEVPELNFCFSGEEETVFHPVVILENCFMEIQSISIDNEALAPEEYKSATITTSGDAGKIIWLDREIPIETTLSIRFTSTTGR